MKSMFAKALALLAFPTLLHAGISFKLKTIPEGARTLPKEAYTLVIRETDDRRLKGGFPQGDENGALSWLWKAEGYDAKKGIRLGKFDWQSRFREGKVLNYLKEQLRGQAEPKGEYELSLTVVAYSDGQFGGNSDFSSNHPAFIVEGQVKDKAGKAVAYFITQHRTSKQNDDGNGWNLNRLVDDFMGSLDREIFR